MNNEKNLYTVKAWDGKSWNHFKSIYLSPYDTDKEKWNTIKKLKEKYGQKYQFNISNFNNVYC